MSGASSFVVGELRELALGASVVVVRRKLLRLEAVRPRGGLLGGLAPLLRRRHQTPRLAGVRVVLVPGVCLFEAVLLHALRDPARTHDDARREDEQTLRAKRVEEISVVGNEQPGAAERFERRQKHAFRVCVKMVRGLVEGQHVGLVPEGDRDLHALAFAVAERFPAARPVRRNAKLPTHVHRDGIPRVHEVVPLVRRRVGALHGVLRGADLADGAVGRRERARRELEDRGLARPVRADDAGPRPFGEVRRHVGQQRFRHPGIGETHAIELEEPCH